MKLASKSLSGVLHNFNKGACDWGWQGMVAYGCQNLVVVVEPNTVQILQTLDKHKGYIVKVKWARENFHHDLANPYSLRLASADYNGKIIAWDVAQASVRAEFSDGSKPVADMEWVWSQDASRDLLAVLHPPYNLVLWNADTGTKLWKKSYTETLCSFSFDPFDPTRLAFLGQDCIVFVDDFSLSKTPSSNGKKYYISSPGGSTVTNSASSDKLDKKSSSKSSTLSKRMSTILGETQKTDSGAVNVNECLELAYHRACRHHLILLYPREVSILDLDINQTVGVIPIDRTGSPFAQVLPLKQRDVLMFLHDNGGVTVRVRRKGVSRSNSAAESAAQTPASADRSPPTDKDVSPPHHPAIDCLYDLRCASDPLRVTKNNRVYAAVVCPVSEMKVALVLSDSRVLIWELKTIDYQADPSATLQTPLYTPGLHPPSLAAVPPPGVGGSGGLQLASQASPPRAALTDVIGHTQTFLTENQAKHVRVAQAAAPHGVLLRFVLTGLLSGVAPAPVILRMCPPLTTKNWATYQPLLALGSQTGLLQVVNLYGGQVTREVSVHSCQVRGIEWVSLSSFISFAYPNPGPSNRVKNEVMLTDIQTGKSVHFRPHREEESPIEFIRVSHLKQYFVIVFKDKPFELWDLRTGTMLRQMPKSFPPVTALEWSPSHNLKAIKKKLTAEAAASAGPAGGLGLPGSAASSTLGSSSFDLSSMSGTSMMSRDSESPAKSTDSTKAVLSQVSAREHFVFTDQDGLLYHFIVEGNMIKDGSKIPPDGGMGAITCIAWKGETLVLGDVDGNLNLWDLKARVSRAVPTHKGWVRKIKFAPGRGNMKLLVLYNDGADIWDAKEVEVVSSLRTPRDLARVCDGDWAASDRPVLALMDGTVRVLDSAFKCASSPMEENQLHDPVFSPYLLPPKAALTLKYLLQHQPWNAEYKLLMEDEEGDAEHTRLVNEQIEAIDSSLRSYLPRAHFGTAQRCLLTARLFGDEADVTFWSVALHYLRAEKAEPGVKRSIPKSPSTVAPADLFVPPAVAGSNQSPSQSDLHQPSSAAAESPEAEQSAWAWIKDRPLETCYDVLMDNHTFQKTQKTRISLHDSKRVTYEHTKRCAENLLLLGETDRAVQLLLETDPAGDTDSYLTDSLRACLVASVRSSGASQSTIKLVATNLIANGKLAEGVQLLCLIDKGLDACRYLQTYGAWHSAAWLAKATLPHAEAAEVMRRWADHLSTPQVNQKSVAVLVLLSLGQFVRVIQMLFHMRYFDRAALFIESCEEFGLLDVTTATDDDTVSLAESVFLEYGRCLLQLGAPRAAVAHYCRRAGARGDAFLTEVSHMYDVGDN